MTVKELKEELEGLDDDMEIIIQKDSEGNGYSPLYGVDADGIYIPETTWCGECWDATWSADDADMEEDEWEELKKKDRSLILYPVN